MASAERELITGIWEWSPQRGSGTEPLVRGSGGRSPLKLVTFLYSKCISCAFLVAFCIGATAARCTKCANLAPN